MYVSHVFRGFVMCKLLFLSMLLIYTLSSSGFAGEVDCGRNGFADLVEVLIPAVVNISSEQSSPISDSGFKKQSSKMPGGSLFDEFRDFFEKLEPFIEKVPNDSDRKIVSLGSGFVVDPSGIIVTNNHVVSNAKEITVTLSDNTQYKAKILGKDARTDLAVLKIDVKRKLKYVEFGDSDHARVGDWVIAVGNPFGLGGTVTAGIISASSRDITISTASDFIQTDAAINRGNSGGPLFNTDGHVIGINTAIFSPSGGSVGVGFAIPSNSAKQVIDVLKEGKKVKHGWLGVKVQVINDDIISSLGAEIKGGAIVAEVVKGGPADKSGIKVGDVILEYNGVQIQKMTQLPHLVAKTKVGDSVDVKLFRGGKNVTIKVVIELVQEGAGQVDDGSDDADETDSSVTVIEDLDMSVINSPNGGVVVTKLAVDSDAYSKGLRVRDVISGVNQDVINNSKEFVNIIKKLKKQKRGMVLLLVTRDGNSMFVSVKLLAK